MSNAKTEIEVPQLRLIEIKLRSLLYRTISTEPLLSDQSEIDVEGSIRYAFYAKRRSSFKVRATQEIKTKYASFRVRHETRFATDTTVSDELLDNPEFRKKVLNRILPFGSELFATLTGKSFGIPFITPGELLEEEAKD